MPPWFTVCASSNCSSSERFASRSIRWTTEARGERTVLHIIHEAIMAGMGADATAVNKYDRQDEAYFSYYSMLTHQAQMLQVSR